METIPHDHAKGDMGQGSVIKIALLGAADA
jgi:hypothetical protein